MTVVSPRTYDYVAYIDESGDTGLKSVKPLDSRGSSEWFVLSAVVIDADREAEVVGWVREIVQGLGRYNRRDLHFRHLGDGKRESVCAAMSKLNARFFAVATNKKNMVGYRNPFAEKKGLQLVGALPTYNWFYYWMSRILLEKVSNFVERKAHQVPQECRPGTR